MAGEPMKELEPEPLVEPVPYREGKVRKQTVYPGFLAAGLTVAEADELCRLIEAE